MAKGEVQTRDAVTTAASLVTHLKKGYSIFDLVRMFVVYETFF